MSKRAKLLIITTTVMYVGLIVTAPFVYAKYQDMRQQQKIAAAQKRVNEVLQTYAYTPQDGSDVSEWLLGLNGALYKSAGPSEVYDQTNFGKQLASLQNDITHLEQVATYSKKVGTLLAGQQFGGKFMNSDDALKQAAKWQAFNDELNNNVASAFVQKQHDVLVKSVAEQVAIAKKASEAYKANDSAALAAQTKAAADELAKIQAVYDDMYALVRAQQAVIAMTITKL